MTMMAILLTNSAFKLGVKSQTGGREGVSKILTTVKRLGDVIGNSLAENTSKTFVQTNIEMEISKTTEPVIFLPKKSQTGDRQQEIKFSGRGEKVFSAALYRTISSILPDSKEDRSVKSSFTSEVLSLDISFSKTNVDAEHPVILTFETDRFVEENNYTENEIKKSCVFWDISMNSNVGGWSTKGCMLKNNTCQCNHLTNFAVLMSPIGMINGVESEGLRIISLIGCSLSIVSTVATIIFYARLWRYVASKRSKLLLNLCGALTVGYILFVTGIDKTDDNNICTALTALLHYFFLSAFCLMLAEGIDILLSVVSVFRTMSRLRWLLIIGWGIPLVVVAVTIGVAYPHEYHSKFYCWLTISNGVLYSFAGPVLGIIAVNIMVLVLVLRALYSTKLMLSKDRKEKVLAGIRSICVLLPVLGITWLFGILSVNDDLIVFQYLFSIFNSLQGLFIFLFYVIFNKQVQRAIRQMIRLYDSRTLGTRLTSSSNKKFSHSDTDYDSNVEDKVKMVLSTEKRKSDGENYNLPRVNIRVKSTGSVYSGGRINSSNM